MAWPVRTRVASTSAARGSPSGYSSAKSSPTLTTPSAAGEGRLAPALPGRRRRRASDKLEDLDPGCRRDAAALHRRAELGVAGEALGLRRGREVVGDEHVVAVGGKAIHPVGGAAVLVADGACLLVRDEPSVVVGDGVTNGQRCGHSLPLWREAISLRYVQYGRRMSPSQ